MVDMNLVSLIDVFTILIFFLLSNAGGVETAAEPEGGQAARVDRREGAARDRVVVVSGTEILVDGRKVALGRRGDGDRRRPDRAAEGRARAAGRAAR